jgi:hypothetical protein
MLRSIALLILLTASSFVFAKAGYEVNTLGANNAVPNRLVENKVDGDAAEALLSSQYMAFYQIKGKLEGNMMRFKNVNAKASFPDARFANVAESIAAMANRPVHNTGSRVRSRATAFVAFYEGAVPGIDASNVQHLTTSSDKAPNVMVALVIQDNDSAGKKGTRTSANQREDGAIQGSDVYLFELAL